MTDDLREKLKAAINDAYQLRYGGEILVMVPHRNDLQTVKDLVASLLWTPPKKPTTFVVGDDYVRVHLAVVFADAAKGRSLNTIFIPADRLLPNKKKIKEAERFRQYNVYRAKTIETYT